MIINFIRGCELKNEATKDETGLVYIYEILMGSLVIILVLTIFSMVGEIHISTPQEVNINEVQDILDSMSFKPSSNQFSLLETSVRKLENSNFSKESYDEVNSLLGTYLNSYHIKNYQLVEFGSSQNPVTLVSKGNFKDANNLKTALRNIGDYEFLLYVWD